MTVLTRQPRTRTTLRVRAYLSDACGWDERLASLENPCSAVPTRGGGNRRRRLSVRVSAIDLSPVFCMVFPAVALVSVCPNLIY